MDSWMGRHNSDAINRASNRTLNDSNLTPANMPSNGALSMINLNIPYVSDGTEEGGFDLYELSNYTSGGISMYVTSRTVSDFVTGVRNNDRSSLQTQNLWHAQTVSSSQTMHIPRASRINLVENNGTSRTMSDFVTGVGNSGLIPSEIFPNNARSSLQTQNLWHAPIVSSSQTMHIPGASGINLVENSTYRTVSEQHTNFHGSSSSASWYPSNAIIQPSSGPVRYLRANGVGDTRRAANLLRNNIDPPPLPLVIGESTVVADNREGLLSAGGSFREPGHRDDPIVIEDDEEDEHADAQQGVIFYDGDMSYEALLALQERIGDVGTELNNKVIFELLMQRKYQSTKMNDCKDHDSCCVCLVTYGNREVLGKIDCGHEFHYHCIRKWLKIKNSCPICKRTALTP